MSSSFEFLSESESDTFEFGQELGQAMDQPCLIFLNGTLGAGKTRLVQAVAAGLDIPPETVNSPTFTIMTPHTGRMILVHVDAYRINDLDEAEQLGLDDWIADGCVMMIEWSERISKVLPDPDLVIDIQQCEKNQRSFSVNAKSSNGALLLEQLKS